REAFRKGASPAVRGGRERRATFRRGPASDSLRRLAGRRDRVRPRKGSARGPERDPPGAPKGIRLTHVDFVAPFFLDATLRFVDAVADVPGVRLGLVSQDPLEKVPPRL